MDAMSVFRRMMILLFLALPAIVQKLCPEDGTEGKVNKI